MDENAKRYRDAFIAKLKEYTDYTKVQLAQAKETLASSKENNLAYEDLVSLRLHKAEYQGQKYIADRMMQEIERLDRKYFPVPGAPSLEPTESDDYSEESNE